MLILLSPAKKIDIRSDAPFSQCSHPDLLDQAEPLAMLLKSYSPLQLSSLMGISDQLAVTNAGRYAAWEVRHDQGNARQAIHAYAGDVYRGLDAASLSEPQIRWAQSRIRILSGLYGILRPLDLIQPYRLEMSTKLPNPRGGDLYAYWKEAITRTLNRELQKRESDVVINLASEEYIRAIDVSGLEAVMITPVFQERKNGKWKIVPVHAKRARGLMARYAALRELQDPARLQSFDAEGYAFDRAASDDGRWFFRRSSA